uniref:Phosphate transporter n=1 Tax=Haematococcus lacustris TaxID=44745 RepID=A0A699YJ50_HAELA
MMVFAFGMLCALIAAWLWVTTATYLEMAVSTTHSIIGAIMGFGLVYGGSQAIVWDRVTTKFPYREGLTPIVIAWFTSPILSGAVAAFLLTLNRVFILRRANSTLLALIFLPPLVTLTIFINVFFGARATLAWSDDKAAWVAICVAGACGLLTIPLVLILRRRLAIHVNK